MTQSTETRKPVVLCILDGWGLRDDPADNALAQANLPNYRRLLETRPFAKVGTSGRDVGLPDGQMGNSEVGHMNIGAGRIAVPDLGRLDNAVADGSLAKNDAITRLIAKLKAAKGSLHLLGLLSDGGVHSHQDHMAALAVIFAKAGVKVNIHMFADGRDTPPKSALVFLKQVREKIAGVDGISFATVSGRFFAMDRDKRWERVSQAYDAIVDAKGKSADTAEAAVEQGYASDESDEFISPTALKGYAGIKDGDGLLMANFRADRAREILTALLDPHFDGFARGRVAKFTAAVGVTEYSTALNSFLTTAYPPMRYPNTIGEVIANAGKNQLRIAETEKYAHVTFFMNGGEEQPFANEDRILVPSPKVKTYDLQPEMSAPEVTDKLCAAITSGKYDLVIVNYANPDMVGHTGSMPAAIKAAETVDACVGKVEAAVRQMDGVLLITADHGNLEQMMDRSSGQQHTQHTTNPVPLLLTGGARTDAYQLSDGRLCDIAPTLLHFIGLPQPKDMTGRVLATPSSASNQTTARRLA